MSISAKIGPAELAGSNQIESSMQQLIDKNGHESNEFGDDLSDDELASDDFLRDPVTAEMFKKSLNKEELLDYLHMKCIHEVNMPIDAKQYKHLRMIGAHHN